MIRLNKSDMKKIVRLYTGDDIGILSCFQGHMGNAWVMRLEEIDCAKIILADFCYLLGYPESEEDARRIITQLQEDACGEIITFENEKWGTWIETIYPDRYRKFDRYHMNFDKNRFSIEKLNQFIDNTPKEYELKKIDKPMYDLVFEKDWTLDLCSNFESADDFLTNGIGYVIMYNNEIVSGASSYSYSNEGIEITIGTQKEHCLKGLALACASKLIIDCIRNNKYPRWDAANMNSVALAQKLGYELKEAYSVYMI